MVIPESIDQSRLRPCSKKGLLRSNRESVYLLCDLLLTSGDLTDAKLSDLRGSRQFEEEWQEYSHILHKSGVTQKTVWLDIRGNHGGLV